MNEKKSNGFAALILSLVVVVACVFVVKFAGGSVQPVVPAPGPDQGSDESQASASKYVAGTYTASARGLNGDVVVTITVDENTIVDVQVDASKETQGIGDKAAAKIAGFILEAQSAEVDTVSSATYTSKATIAAAADCLAQAANNGGAAEGGEAEASGIYKPGTYTAEAQGIQSKVGVTVTVDANAILSIEVDASGETSGIGDKAAAKVAGFILAAQSTEVDTVSSATYSSKAVIAAVADCLAQAAN